MARIFSCYRNQITKYLKSRSPNCPYQMNLWKSWRWTWMGPDQRIRLRPFLIVSGSVALTSLQRPGSSRWTSGFNSMIRSNRQSLGTTATFLITPHNSLTPYLKTARVCELQFVVLCILIWMNMFIQLCANTVKVKNCCHCYSHDNKKCEVHNNSWDYPESLGSLCLFGWEKCSSSERQTTWIKVLLLCWHGLPWGTARYRYFSILVEFVMGLFVQYPKHTIVSSFVASDTSGWTPH